MALKKTIDVDVNVTGIKSLEELRVFLAKQGLSFKDETLNPDIIKMILQKSILTLIQLLFAESFTYQITDPELIFQN